MLRPYRGWPAADSLWKPFAGCWVFIINGWIVAAQSHEDFLEGNLRGWAAEP